MHFHQWKRREFMTLLGGAAAWPLAARAQHPMLPPLGEPPPEAQTYGMSQERRVGDIAAGSHNFTITSPAYSNKKFSMFKLGDRVIIEVGGEAGGGLRGTLGVGGKGSTVGIGDYQFYTDIGWPLALIATVVAVSADGKVLALDKAAATASTGANIWFDNHFILQNFMPKVSSGPQTINIPAGVFAVSAGLHNQDPLFPVNGWTINGQGKDVTILKAPKGASGVGMMIRSNDSQGVKVRDMTLIGNVRQDGYGIENLGGFQLSPGVHIAGGANHRVERVKVQDVFLKAVWLSYTSASEAIDCDYIATDAMRNYFANWFFGCSDSGPCTFTRCKLTSTYMIWGFETFRSSGSVFNDCESVNGMFACNSSGLWTLHNFTARFTKNCLYLGGVAGGIGVIGNAMIQANSNIQPPSPDMELGGVISNLYVTIEGLMTQANPSMMICVNINSLNPNIDLDGTLIDFVNTADYAAGVHSDVAMTVRNLTVTGVIGPNHWPFANIALAAGSTITNCTANKKTIGGVRWNSSRAPVTPRRRMRSKR